LSVDTAVKQVAYGKHI